MYGTFYPFESDARISLLAIAINNKVGVRPPLSVARTRKLRIPSIAQMLSIDFPYEKSDQAVQRVSPEAAASSALLQQI
jgi:hypothetical protein